MRRPRTSSTSEFVSVKLAFFHRITAWADALEAGDVDVARLELRHLEVLSERLVEDELFLKATAAKRLCPHDLVACLSGYLSAITDSMHFASSESPQEKFTDRNGEHDAHDD